MNLYLVARTDKDHSSYDTYDSFVCTAPSAKAAVRIHPCHDSIFDERILHRDDNWVTDNWVSHPRMCTATYLGRDAVGMPSGVILASYNAG